MENETYLIILKDIVDNLLEHHEKLVNYLNPECVQETIGKEYIKYKFTKKKKIIDDCFKQLLKIINQEEAT